MSKVQQSHNRRRAKRRSQALRRSPDTNERRYHEAGRLAEAGDHARARQLYERLRKSASDARLRAQIENDLGVLAAVAGDVETARNELRRQMGLSGRRRFEEHYSWPVIIDRHYRPLLKACQRVG